MTPFTEHFDLEEVAPRKHQYLTAFRPRFGEMLEQVRAIVGPVTANDWASGGRREWCGARFPECREWSPGSEHSVRPGHLCTAADLHSTRWTGEQMRAMVLAANPPLVGRMEGGVSWLHVDMGKRNADGTIHVFAKPKPKAKPA